MAGTFVAFAVLIALAARQLITAVATFRATAWVPVISRRMSSWVTAHHYTQDSFFDADGADAASVDRRKNALDRLSSALGARHARSADWGDRIREGFSDLRFADANRVPFPFAPTMRERFNLTTVVTASDGPRLRDLDGGWSLDVSGSYGLNVAGFDRLQGLDSARLGSRERSRPGARSGPSHRRRQHPDASRRLWPGRCVLSHERHRGGHGCCSPGPLQHAPAVSSSASPARTTAGGTASFRALEASGPWTTASP